MISKENIIKLIDLTSLNTTDGPQSITRFIEKANSGFNGSFPASVCVYPKFAKLIKESVLNPVKTCVVSTYFPSSQSPNELKLQEIDYLSNIGIDEIDIVLPIGDFLEKNYDSVYNELMAIRKRTSKTLKLIIETGVLKEQDLIKKASEIGISTNMDFIKTSTGKAGVGADIESVKTMANAIKNSSKTVGLKVAGGIKTYTEANEYIQTCESILGSDFINPKFFRIGASSLYNQLIQQDK